MFYLAPYIFVSFFTVHFICNVAKSANGILSLSLRFNGHFPGEPGLAGVC